ncbi:MAG: peptide chain release factor N(5)-glutamine methyltransferase [Massilibacteroides sp.]|nr:peptide chain release factor N(5)-glutamine methyltransferase [Massilibacteroides sp.]MDD4115725.1 peptide chain release factor N(5)-glutamine methyltransferase [Massilibacteroides sp.]MDD4659398.1 peptide chain release factor N(5)-glutamine methyltransferase [Massilibacteroides sp.]
MNETLAYLKQALGNQNSPEEVRSLIHLIMKKVCRLEPHQLFLDKDKDLSDAEKAEIRLIVQRLSRQEPIQYILGETLFYGYRFRVTPAVLIPRPETEELVERIIREEKTERLQVLDIGTGSGCIAVSLARQLNQASVWAVDISEEALSVARENAKRNLAEVTFLQMDVLQAEPELPGKLDLLVSNPPYVMNGEKQAMEQNVLNYEPHQALFVSDNDPLVFYRAIADLGRRLLKEGGRLYLEINAALGKETLDVLKERQYKECQLEKDLSGKDRMIKAIR